MKAVQIPVKSVENQIQAVVLYKKNYDNNPAVIKYDQSKH